MAKSFEAAFEGGFMIKKITYEEVSFESVFRMSNLKKYGFYIYK
jgi:hypothetical protein